MLRLRLTTRRGFASRTLICSYKIASDTPRLRSTVNIVTLNSMQQYRKTALYSHLLANVRQIEAKVQRRVNVGSCLLKVSARGPWLPNLTS